MSREDFVSIFELTLISANLDIVSLTLIDDNTVQITFKGGGTRKVNIEADSHNANTCKTQYSKALASSIYFIGMPLGSKAGGVRVVRTL